MTGNAIDVRGGLSRPRHQERLERGRIGDGHTFRHWGESVLLHVLHSRRGWIGAPRGADGPGNDPSRRGRVESLPSIVFTPVARTDRELGAVEPELNAYSAGRSGGLTGGWVAEDATEAAASRRASSFAYESPHALHRVLGPSGP
jgi:hypothetical protein